jgi:hypothetical protein
MRLGEPVNCSVNAVPNELLVHRETPRFGLVQRKGDLKGTMSALPLPSEKDLPKVSS